MSKFDLNALLNNQSATPGGPRMVVSQIPREQIRRNPENDIYIIGDVTQLAEDIAANGIRQPLEVVPAEDGYLLIGGHRRLTACEWLAEHGIAVFDTVPCIVRQSKGAAADKLDLITANATARELTDGERLDQYIAMKAALEELKREGKLEGRVRDEMVRRLGESSGGLGRLNAIAANCTEEVRQLVRDGKCGITRAYEASKLPSRKQLKYAETGSVPPTPLLPPDLKAFITQWILESSPAAELLRKVDYGVSDQWGYLSGTGLDSTTILDIPGGLMAIVKLGTYSFVVSVPDPADESQEIYHEAIRSNDLYGRAKQLYWSKEAQEKAKAEKAAQRAKEAMAREASARIDDILNSWKDWPHHSLEGFGLTVYEFPLRDGGKLQALNSDAGPSYLWPRWRRVDKAGQPVVSSTGQPGWANYVGKDEKALLGEPDRK